MVNQRFHPLGETAFPGGSIADGWRARGGGRSGRMTGDTGLVVDLGTCQNRGHGFGDDGGLGRYQVFGAQQNDLAYWLDASCDLCLDGGIIDRELTTDIEKDHSHHETEPDDRTDQDPGYEREAVYE